MKINSYIRSWIVIGSFLFVISSCKYLPILGGSNSVNTSGSKEYSEDLTSLRPAFEIPEREMKNEIPDLVDPIDVENTSYYIPVNDTVNTVLDSIARLRLTENRVTGYTIMVYSSMNRAEAVKELGRLYGILPDAKSDLVYQQPYFKIKTGKYLSEIDAYSILNDIKSVFPTAIIVPESYQIVEKKK